MMIAKGLIASGFILSIMLVVSLWAMGIIPEGELYASHFGLDGRADGFSSRNGILWTIPLIALISAVFFSLLPKIDPRRQNLLRSGLPYLVSWIGASIILLFVHLTLVLNAAQIIDVEDVANGSGSIRWLTVLIGGFVLVLGSVLGKVRPNWFLGIRTPWTLSSDLSWDKTHRLFGYLFMIAGFATIIVGLTVIPSWAFAILGISAVGATLGAFVYSWFVWKNDPARETLVPEEAD